MTRLLLVRHGTTDAVGKVLSGRASGYPLNEAGLAQVHVLRDGLSALEIAAVYSSPLERAVQTAAVLASPRGLPVTVDERLSDIDFGAWSGRAISELRNDAKFLHFNRQRSLAQPPLGERISQVQARMVAALHERVMLHPQGTVAIVGHADPLRLAIAFFIGLAVDHAHRLEIEPASESTLEFLGDDVRLLHLNHKYPGVTDV